MDPSTHSRFLEYIELCEGFLRGGMQKLDRDSFPPLDAEYQALIALEEKGLLDAEQARRIVVLRRVLLQD
ncbi:MAG: hypothetical protein JRH11_09755 [Deltaproteobacteria bacterium]|nr:hypothetical protein [Deltaproteobacteria bacterium]